MSSLAHVFNNRDSLEVKKQKLAAENEVLENKLKILKDRVRKVREQSSIASYEESSMASMPDIEEQVKTGSPILIQATEQLVDIKVLQYHVQPSPQTNMPRPGKWKKVNIDMIIAGTLKASVSFFDDGKPDSEEPIESLCSMVGTKLARLELDNFIETFNCRNDLSGLIAGLRSYAYLAQERKTMLNDICTNNDQYLQAFIGEEGILLKWAGGLFTISWAIEWSENYGKIINKVDVILRPENRDFNMACEEAFDKMTRVSSTNVERVEALQTIISRALIYHMTI